MQTSIRTIIFDFDGVLAESVGVKTRAFAKLYEAYGETVQKAVVSFTPKVRRKLVNHCYMDMRQGLLECLNEMYGKR